MSTTPDPSALEAMIASFDRLSRQWQQRAEELAAAAEGTAVEVDRPGVRLRVQAPELLAVDFDEEQVRRVGPVQLREHVLSAYAEAVTSTTRARAADLATLTGEPTLAEGLLATLPPEVTERAESSSGPAAQPVPAAPSVRPRADAPAADPTGTTAGVRPGQTVTEAMADTGWTRPSGPPEMWQYELERRVAALSSAATGLREAVEQVSATAECSTLRLVVNAAGALTDITFLAASRSAGAERLAEDLMSAYGEASADAAAQLQQLVTQTPGLAPPPDDPTLALFQRLDGSQR